MNNEYWFDFVAGWIGGCAGLLVGQPMDTIKVRQQTLKRMNSVNYAISIFKYEGIRGFYKGLGFPLLASGTLNSLFFGVYGNSIRWLSEGKQKPSVSDVLIAGSAGGVAQLVVACPVDLIKIKMQMQTGSSRHDLGNSFETKYRGPVLCLQDIYKKGGVAGCYTGFNSMFLRDVIASGVYMATYEVIVGFNTSPSAYSIILGGGVAGLLSWTAILPFDVIKSRIQADCPTNPRYKNTWDCVMKSYKEEGLLVFTRGYCMMAVRAFPTNGAIFLAYVTSLNILKDCFGLNEKEKESQVVMT
ncbi:solute carrier family 25 member 45 isoform X2 [Cherax quadricarinatus]|uniref:solute carrier family 25 member 45 isoform X2 n=1 Tax=Cherax quadricarinatus TaxID=27406 RepID=UPI002378AD27|nr:solute carrier family 25 member 45-like [Cherax quadricarinatus]